MREAAYVVHTRHFTYTHSYTRIHTTGLPCTPCYTACHYCISITRGSEDLFLIQSVSAGVTSLALWFLPLRLPCSPARSPVSPSLDSHWCVSAIVGLVDAGVRCVCVRVCVRHPLRETVLAKFCTSGKMTLSKKGGNPGLTLFLQKACRVFETLCCYCQRWVQLLESMYSIDSSD